MGTANVAAKTVKLYPVPVKDVLHIEVPGLKSGESSIEIYSADGRKVYSASSPSVSANRLTVNVGHLAKGSYFGRLQQGGQTYPLNFTKN
jgi:pectate lyase